MTRARIFASLLPLAFAVAGLGAVASLGAHADEAPHVVPAPAQAAPASSSHTLVLGGGCFWGVQGVFEHVRGVTRSVAGYSGGSPANATYEEVSTGTTGHAESVSITYDPAVVDEGKLLQIYFSVVADPTERDRQGPDTGTQYRSVVFAQSTAEAEFVRRYIASLDTAHAFARPIATTVEPFHGFNRAETYHQDFLARNPDDGYIAINDIPKVNALRTLFPAQYDARPVLVANSGS